MEQTKWYIREMNKEQLRMLASKVKTIDNKKLSKMSKEKLIPIVNHLTLSQVQSLTK